MSKGLEAFNDLIYNYEHLGKEQFNKDFATVEKELKDYEKLKQDMKEEYNNLVTAMQQNLDFSDEEDVRHYDKLQAQAFILNKFLIMLERC